MNYEFWKKKEEIYIDIYVYMFRNKQHVIELSYLFDEMQNNQLKHLHDELSKFWAILHYS